MTYTKDPNATLDYTINWVLWLNGDTISTSTWTVPAGLTSASNTHTTTTTTIWLSGGTVDTTYQVVNRIVTALGRIDDRTMTIVVGEK